MTDTLMRSSTEKPVTGPGRPRWSRLGVLGNDRDNTGVKDILADGNGQLVE